MSRTRLLLLPALLVLPVVVAGCSGGGGDPETQASPSSQTATPGDGGSSDSAPERTAGPVGTPDQATPEAEVSTPQPSVDEEALAAGDLSADRLEAVSAGEAVSVNSTVVVSIDPMSASELEAGPGEMGGAGVVVPVKLTNTTDSEVALDGLVTVVTYGSAGTPAPEVVTASDEIPASLAPGQTLVIERAFSVPEEGRDQVEVAVDLGADYPAAVFEGSVPS